MKTRVTELLGIQRPIIQGGMQNLGLPELAAAVSNAGGCGTINRTIYKSNEDLYTAIRRTKELTDKPFLVNVSLLPGTSVGDETAETIRICGEAGVAGIETAGTDPKALVSLVHQAGMFHIHKVPGAKYALSAQRAGCDAVTVAGFECGGHPGKDKIGSLVLTNRAACLCDIPVIAAGGYADGRGLAAALSLGAEGVVMGTRFVATQECAIHQHFKQWILSATENDTLLCQKTIRNMVRVADNACARQCLELESKPGMTLEQLMPVIQGARGRAAYQSGDVGDCLFPIGNNVGLINDIPTVQQLMDRMMEEYQQAVQRLLNFG